MLPVMWRSIPLTLFWFVHMGALGVFFPYFSLYLKENAGLSGVQLGWVLAIVPLVGIVAQPFWGQVADRTGARSRIVAFLALGSVFGYLSLSMAQGVVAISLATAAIALFSTAVLPVTISVTLALLRDAGPYAFGFVRVWGTVGYLLLVLIFPWILSRYQTMHGLVPGAGGISEPGLEIMFVVAASLVSLSALLGLFLPRKGAVSLRAKRGDWKSLLASAAYRRFLLFAFGAYLLSSGPMWLFPILVRARGGDVGTIRRMWLYMLVVEIPLILATGSGLKRIGARGLLGVGVFANGLRWVLCALINDLRLLALVQMLHGVTVVGLLMGGPLYLDVIAPQRLRSTAQAVLAMVGVGIAGIVSNLGSGWLLEHANVDILYVSTGAGSAALGALVWWILPAPERPPEDQPAFR
jgi:PPP family 3-phenylpropionic acid transporter